ncbi:MAG: FIST C-terminal domain-containing protein [Treponema sp.]|jgi:hypothetical protein|nr:FIST C-terminal domain-containing protein [Treponema sp.]
MIKMLTAYTFEIDDSEIAVREILEQLDFGHNLLKNTTALMFCHRDFINSGTAEAIGKALPFDVLGCTTLGIALPSVFGEMILVVAALTSDEVDFVTGLSEPLVEDEERRIGALYQSLSARLPGPPALILAVQPMLNNIGGDFIVHALDQFSGGVPIFGTGALDVTIEPRTPMTIYNGRASSSRLALLLLSERVTPHFVLDSLGEQKAHSQRAVITAAEGNRIISINNTPATVYMEKIGLINKGALNTLFAFPITIENPREGEINNCIIQSREANGSLVCSCGISAGSTLYVGVPTAEAVLKTVVNITRQAKAEQDRNLLFIFSCFSRSIVLVESGEEMNLIQKELAGLSLPYLFLYSGGEVCPVKNSAGRMLNRHHNYAIISCSF